MIAGDLNNTSAMRAHVELEPDAAYSYKSLAISASEDDPETRATYRPFLFEDEEVARSDWVSRLELSTALKMAEEDFINSGERLRILMLYGSLRAR